MAVSVQQVRKSRVKRGIKSKKVGSVSKKKLSTKKAAPAKKAKKSATVVDVESLVLEYRANARKLSRSILRRWHARLDIEELDSLVDLALCEAAKRFDPTKGASFMTFLFYHLRGCLVRAVDAAANVNTIPASSFEIAELSSDYSSASYKNGTYTSGSSGDIASALCNHEYLLPDEILYRKEVAVLSNLACSKLDQLEQEVIYRIYMLEQPLVDIARTLGYSRCHISRVKKKALETLQTELSRSVYGKEKIEGLPVIEEEEVAERRTSGGRRKTQRRNIDSRNQRPQARYEELQKFDKSRALFRLTRSAFKMSPVNSGIYYTHTIELLIDLGSTCTMRATVEVCV
ncbi:MAG: sigma-70 family RNA polymerase sigma factor [Bdellovibrionales bacterium]|nr:sigma-70 family RNA polymerase sigma factor [Bdellovibrionales bacterium]